MANAKINSTDPPNNSVILLGTSTLTINYGVPVLLSTRNITIFQVDGKNIRTRKSVSGLCKISSDNRIVFVKVFYLDLYCSYDQYSKDAINLQNSDT